MSLVGSFVGWGVVGAYVHYTFMLKQSNTSVISSNKKIIITARGIKQMHLSSPLLDSMLADWLDSADGSNETYIFRSCLIMRDEHTPNNCTYVRWRLARRMCWLGSGLN